ncbi:MAG: hypothetical protein WBP13_06460 [Methylophilaceae bacterium]
MNKLLSKILDTLVISDQRKDDCDIEEAIQSVDSALNQALQIDFTQLNYKDKSEVLYLLGYAYDSYMNLLKLKICIDTLLVSKNEINCDQYRGWLWYYSHAQKTKDLADHKKILALAKTTLSYLTNDKASLYSGDYKRLRFAFRTAYVVLSLENFSNQDVTASVKHIDDFFKIKSGIDEYENPFVEGYEVKSLAYYEQYKQQPEKFEKKFFDALIQLESKEKTEYRVSILNEHLKSFLSNKKYVTYKNNGPIEKLRTGKSKESWQDAIKRFKKMSKLVTEMFEYEEDETDWNHFKQYKNTSFVDIENLETKHQCKVPESLKDLFMHFGGFELRDKEGWGSLCVYSGAKNQYFPIFAGLLDMIEMLWGNRPEFEQYLAHNEIQSLNSSYFVFGHIFHDDNAYTHLFFTIDGKFGSVYYDQDNFNEFYESVKGLLANEGGFLDSLDVLISKSSDVIIEALIEWKEEKEMEG